MHEDKLISAVERRQFFRIDDEVALSYRRLTGAELEAEVARLHSGSPDKLSLASGFASTSAEMRRAIDRVRREVPDVATYLEALNEKLDLLVQLLAASDGGLSESTPQEVSLSASGISFTTDEPIALGSNIEIKLLMYPSYVCVVAFGHVAHCQPVEKQRPTVRHTIGVEFTHIRESDRDLIVRHITKKQSTILREARQALE